MPGKLFDKLRAASLVERPRPEGGELHMDIYVNPNSTNAARIMIALNDFGFDSAELSATDFEAEDRVVQLGLPPVRIDIVTSLTGISWEEAASGRIEGKYGDVFVYYIGRQQFISNKRASGRKKDLADLEPGRGVIAIQACFH